MYEFWKKTFQSTLYSKIGLVFWTYLPNTNLIEMKLVVYETRMEDISKNRLFVVFGVVFKEVQFLELDTRILNTV